MYPINAPAVFAHESVMAEPAYREKVERVVAALGERREIEVYSDDQLPSLIRERGLLDRCEPMGTYDVVDDPILLFNRFRFDDETAARARREQAKAAGLTARPELFGLRAFDWANYNLADDPNRAFKVCRPCWRIHLQAGCLHKCAYCGLGGLLVAMVNVDEYCQHLETLIDRHPWQKTYLLDDDADPPGLEPELGCLGELIEFFGELDDRYLIVHTKTWNTEWLEQLNHNGNTIVVWSLSGASQSALIEPNTGTGEERVEAARVAEAAGYPVRFKFKPILPVRNWRQEASDTIAQVFAQTRPDVISLCSFMWMDIDEMKRRLSRVVDLFDPEFLAAAEAARGATDNPKTLPFPDAARAAIYDHYIDEIRKHDPDIPVSLSTESWQMWSRFAPKLGMTATDYVCGCGPQTTPGARRLECHPFKTAVRDDRGDIPCVWPAFELKS